MRIKVANPPAKLWLTFATAPTLANHLDLFGVLGAVTAGQLDRPFFGLLRPTAPIATRADTGGQLQLLC